MPGFSSWSSWVSSLYGAASPAGQEPSQEGQLRVSQIIAYPIKSCAGVQLDACEYGVGGLKYDRRWMIIDADTKKMVTARAAPGAKLFLVEPRVDEAAGQLRIRIPYHGDFAVPLVPDPTRDELVTDLQVWGSYDLGGYNMTPAGSALRLALAAYLEADCLLVCKAPEHFRTLGGQRFLEELFGGGSPSLSDGSLDYPLEEATTDFSDGYPFLLASESSFAAVERWLVDNTADVRMHLPELVKRYRPNIVVAGTTEGFEEESWEELLLGGAQTLFPVSRCARCPMPNVSPKTGTVSARRMPGQILEKYRKGVDKIVKGPCLGMNCLPKARSGTLSVGMPVEVIKRAPRRQEDEDMVRGPWVRQEDRWV